MSFLFSGHNYIHSYNIHRASHYRGKELGGASRLLLHPQDKLLLQAAGSLTRTHPACARGRAAPCGTTARRSPSLCPAASQQDGEAAPAGVWLLLTLLQHPPTPVTLSRDAQQCHVSAGKSVPPRGERSRRFWLFRWRAKEISGPQVPASPSAGSWGAGKPHHYSPHPAHLGDGVATTGGRYRGGCIGTGPRCPLLGHMSPLLGDPALAGALWASRAAASGSSANPLSWPQPQQPNPRCHHASHRTSHCSEARRWLQSSGSGLRAVLAERGSTAASRSG